MSTPGRIHGTPPERVVIVGGGQGALQLATSLRDEGFLGGIDMVSAEHHIPYQRPALSKAYLAEGSEHHLNPPDAAFLDSRGIRLHPGTSATRIDRHGARLELSSGEVLPYDRLVLATGAQARRPELSGTELRGVFTLRTRDDADALRRHLGDDTRITAIGGGFIGLEVASVLRSAGLSVTVLERNARLMRRSCSAPLADFMLEAHRRMGTEVVLEQTVDSLTGISGAVRSVRLGDHTTLEADTVLLSTGVVPNTDLARDAGLEVGDGIRVDAALRTRDRAIYAIGDCASFPSVHADRHIRLESVQNAVDQARHVARAVVTGEVLPYARTPWFWSNQAGHRLQMVGIAGDGAQHYFSGDVHAGKFSIFLFDDDVLTRVESVNDARTHLAARKLFDEGISVDLETVQAAEFDLKALLTPAPL